MDIPKKDAVLQALPKHYSNALEQKCPDMTEDDYAKLWALLETNQSLTMTLLSILWPCR